MALDTTNALIDFDYIRDKIKTIADTDQERVESLINAASLHANSHTKRLLLARDYTDDYDGQGTEEIVLNQFPVNSITSIYIDAERDFTADTELTSDNYIYYDDIGVVVRTNGSFGRGRKNVRINYNAGFATVPEDLKLSVSEMVMWMMKREVSNQIGVKSITAPDGVNTAMELSMPLSVRTVWDLYRRAEW
jgi:hypothetical protein